MRNLIPDYELPHYKIDADLEITDKWESIRIGSKWYCTIPFYDFTRILDDSSEFYCLWPIDGIVDWLNESQIPINLALLLKGEKPGHFIKNTKFIALEFDTPEFIAAIQLFWK